MQREPLWTPEFLSMGGTNLFHFWFLDLGFVAQAFGYAFLYSVLNTAVILLTAVLYFVWRRA